MRTKVTVRLAVLGLLPVTVIVEVLAAAFAPAVTVSVVEQVGLHEDDENAAVTPAGSADREKLTVCVVPATRVAVIVVAADGPPAVSVTLPGLAARE